MVNEMKPLVDAGAEVDAWITRAVELLRRPLAIAVEIPAGREPPGRHELTLNVSRSFGSYVGILAKRVKTG